MERRNKFWRIVFAMSVCLVCLFFVPDKIEARLSIDWENVGKVESMTASVINLTKDTTSGLLDSFSTFLYELFYKKDYEINTPDVKVEIPETQVVNEINNYYTDEVVTTPAPAIQRVSSGISENRLDGALDTLANSLYGYVNSLVNGKGDVGVVDVGEEKVSRTFLRKQVERIYDSGLSVGDVEESISNIDEGTLYIDRDNNRIGIGTTTPEYRLDVSGIINASDVYIDGVALSPFSTSSTRETISETITGIDYSSSTGIFSLDSSYVIPLTASTTAWENKVSSQWTSSSTDLYYSGGAVGVGTNSPSATIGGQTPIMTVAGYANINGLRLNGADTSNTIYSGSGININSTGGAIGLIANNGISFTPGGLGVAMTIDNSTNNVGIGTTTPSQKLSVSGNMDLTGALYFSTSTSGTSPQVNVLANAFGTRFLTIYSPNPSLYPGDSTFFGYNSGNTSISSGAGNTAFGKNSMAGISTGSNNAAFGRESMVSNTIGDYNTAVGDYALNANTTAGRNVAVGHASLLNNNGAQNVGVGYSSLQSNSSGVGSTGIGYDALRNNNGSYNASLGYQSLTHNTTGIGNIGIGYLAGADLTSTYSNLAGDYNVFIGYQSGLGVLNTSSTISKSVAIGYNAKVSASNTLVLGGTGADAVNVGIGTSTPNYLLSLYKSALPIQDINFTNTGSFGRYQLSEGNSNPNGFLQLIGSNYATANRQNNLEIGTLNNGGFGIYTSGLERMRVDSSGNVGIGISSPAYKLHIQESSSDPLVAIRNTSSSGYSGIEFVSSANSFVGGIGYANASTIEPNLSDKVYLYSSNKDIAITNNLSLDSEGIIVKGSTGRLGIGTTTPAEKLVVNGNAQFTAVTGGTYSNDLNITSTGVLTTSASDRRLKTNLNELSSSTLDSMLLLKPYTFEWIGDPEKKRDIGLIAQDVESIFPELTFTNKNDGFMGINYSRLSVLFVKAFQELNTKIENLVINVKELILDKLMAKSIIINNTDNLSATGITIFDRDTGDPVCMYIERGNVRTENGECGKGDSEPDEEEEDDHNSNDNESSEIIQDNNSTTTEVIIEEDIATSTPDSVVEETAPEPTQAVEPEPEPVATEPEPVGEAPVEEPLQEESVSDESN